MKTYGVLFINDNGEPQTDKVYIPALTMGAAVEVSLAFHGMFRYDRALVSESKESVSEGYSLDNITRIYGDEYLSQEWAWNLDEHHMAGIEEVADNWKESLP